MDVLRKACCREIIFDLCDSDVEIEMLCLSHELGVMHSVQKCVFFHPT